MKNKFINYLLVSLLFLYTAVNVFASLSHPELLYEVIARDNPKSIIIFLRKLKKNTEFKNQLTYFSALFGSGIKIMTLEPDVKREKKITEAKEVLSKNPLSRDALLFLASLYLEKDKKNTATDYYKQAQNIDPWLNAEEFENADY